MSKVKKSGTSGRRAGASAAADSKGRGQKPTKKKPKAPLKTREIPVARSKDRLAAQSGSEEPMSQLTLKMRQSQHRELSQMAFDAGTTMRGIIMRALKSKGLTVTKEDLGDRRRK